MRADWTRQDVMQGVQLLEDQMRANWSKNTLDSWLLHASQLHAPRVSARRRNASNLDAASATTVTTAATAPSATRLDASTCHESECKYMRGLDAKAYFKNARKSMHCDWTPLLPLVTECRYGARDWLQGV